MQGASAIQAALREIPHGRIRALVVWEPVLPTDWAAPTSTVLSRVSDPRAVQFWDKGRLVSHHVRLAGVDPGDPGPVVWDFVALFAPGIRWDTSFPTPQFAGRTVLEVIDEVRRRLPALAQGS